MTVRTNRASPPTTEKGIDMAYGASTVKRRRRTGEELDAVDEAILTAVAEEHPVTLRGVYYRVVSAGAVDKDENGYRLVGRQVLKLRRSGRLPYRHITDGTRWVSKPDSWNDVEDLLNDIASSYRRALWRDQGVEVHVFTEKDAISGAISPVTAKWDVPLGVLRGYASETFCHSMAEAIKVVNKPVYVYQLGDHDPSGIGAWNDFQQKVTRFIGAHPWPVSFERIAVTPEQITRYGLLTRPTKSTDSRAKSFQGESVEVDAIPPTLLRSLLEERIVQHIDPEAYRLTTIAEESERAGLYRLMGGTESTR